jgi:hypothetical protein
MRFVWKVFALLIFLIPSGIARADKIDLQLADIVGGGNGTGTGVHGAGINPLTGSTTPPPSFSISQPNNTNAYHLVTHPFIDGVFIPDGGAPATTLDSAGHTFAGFPNTISQSWDMIKYGPNSSSGFTLNSINYDLAPNNMIGMHANKGITFDLDAMELAHPGYVADHFTAVAGMSRVSGAYGTSDFWVFLDGVLQTSQVNTTGGVGFLIDLNLNPNSRFLTLVSTDNGNDATRDQIIFGNPVVTLTAPAVVPEPSAVILLAIGGACVFSKWYFGRSRNTMVAKA